MNGTTRQLLRFCAVGAAGTGAYLATFVLLRPLGPQAASLAARVLVALPTSWLNARLTFRSRVRVRRAYAGGLAGLVLGAALAAATLAVVHGADPRPSRPVELSALASAQLVAAAARFALLRRVAVPADAQGAHNPRRRPTPTVQKPASAFLGAST